MNVELIAVPKSSVRDMWPLVDRGLRATREQYECRWLPEDVYLALMAGSSFLYMIDVDQATQGFVVIKSFADFDGAAMHIWVLYSAPQMMKHADNYEKVLKLLEDMARAAGAKRIRHESPRDGWTAKGMFKLAAHIYEREVLQC